MQKSKWISVFGLMFGLMFVTACSNSDTDGSNGSSGVALYSGPLDQAALDTGNREELLFATSKNLEFALRHYEYAETLDAFVSDYMGQVLEICQDNTGTLSEPERLSGGTFVFDNYCVLAGGNRVVLTGTLDFRTENNTIVASTSGLIVEIDDEVNTLNGTIILDEFNNALSIDFRSGDGNVYRIRNLFYTITSDFGLVIKSGEFFHPGYGYVDLSVTISNALFYEDVCMSGLPVGGMLGISGSESGAAIAFFDCDDYTIT